MKPLIQFGSVHDFAFPDPVWNPANLLHQNASFKKRRADNGKAALAVSQVLLSQRVRRVP